MPNQVVVDVVKTALRHWNGVWLELDVSCTLPHWQSRHALAMRVKDLAICGQQNLAVMLRNEWAKSSYRSSPTPGPAKGGKYNGK